MALRSGNERAEAATSSVVGSIVSGSMVKGGVNEGLHETASICGMITGKKADCMEGRYDAWARGRMLSFISSNGNAIWARRDWGGGQRRIPRKRRVSCWATRAKQQVLLRLGLNGSYNPLQCSVSVWSRARKSLYEVQNPAIALNCDRYTEHQRTHPHRNDINPQGHHRFWSQRARLKHLQRFHPHRMKRSLIAVPRQSNTLRYLRRNICWIYTRNTVLRRVNRLRRRMERWVAIQVVG